MNHWVDIKFDCLPLRSISRMDVPLDASPKYREFCERVKAAMEKHGSFNSYYLYNAHCIYHMTNDNELGLIDFRFTGTVLTDQLDRKTSRCDLQVELAGETCDWLSEPIVHWFQESVRHSVQIEFDRYIDAGDLDQTRQRIEKLQSESDQAGGFVGMYL